MHAATPWERCPDCNKIVRVNKPLFGSLHLCLSEQQRLARQAMLAQQHYRSPSIFKGAAAKPATQGLLPKGEKS